MEKPRRKVRASKAKPAVIVAEEMEGVPGALYPFQEQDPAVMRIGNYRMQWDKPESLDRGDDVIFARKLEEEIRDGELVVALCADGGSMIGRLRSIDSNHVDLVPQNSQFDAKRLKRADVQLRRVKVIISYRYHRHATGAASKPRGLK